MNKKIYLVTITFLIILFNSNGLTAQMGKWFVTGHPSEVKPLPKIPLFLEKSRPAKK